MEELEIIHRRFCKSALGVTTTIYLKLTCYGKLGRSRLMIKRKVLMVKYLRVADSWDISPLVKDVYTLAKNHSLQWTT